MNEEILAVLQPRILKIARAILDRFPFLQLTSGLRSWDAQAHAMAVDISAAGTFDWINQVYVASDAQKACYAACINAGIMPSDVQGTCAVLLGAFALLRPDQLHHLDVHCTGEAVDFEPLTDDRAPAVVSALREAVTDEIAAGGSAKFLDHEGQLPRWHLQAFEPSQEIA